MGTDIHTVFQAKTPEGWVDVDSEYKRNRHYLLFAWLGDVRNGYGFAGCTTHQPIQPLSSCRGLPKDFLLNNYECHLDTWMGNHSYSYVFSSEVLDTKLPTITKTGIIDKDLYAIWDGVSEPSSWCGGISGPGIVVDTEQERTEKTTHIRVFWEKSLEAEFEYFLTEIRRLVSIYGEIRMVFGFDS